jgi:hypothetical protein
VQPAQPRMVSAKAMRERERRWHEGMRSYGLFSAEEVARLREDVRQLGQKWAAIAALDCWSHRSAESLRNRWKRLPKEGNRRSGGPVPESAVEDSIASEVQDVSGNAQQSEAQLILSSASWAFRSTPTMAERLTAVKGRAGMHGGRSAIQSMGNLDLQRQEGEGSRRDAHGHWRQAVKRANIAEARTTPTPQHAKWIQLWQLEDDCGEGGYMLCHFRSATLKLRAREQKSHPTWSAAAVRKHCNQLALTISERDELGLTVYQGSRAKDKVVHTLLASRPQETWVCGPAAGRGHYVSACCAAAFMGYPTNSGVIWHARRLLPEEEVLSILGDSVYLPFAEALARFAWGKLCSRWLLMATYGSFYSGGVDAFAAALRRLLKRLDTIFIAELLEERRELLVESYAPRHVFVKAADAALKAPSVVWASWTAPCRKVTQALAIPSGKRERAQHQAAKGVALHMESLTTYVVRCFPIVVLGEQSSGMATHNHQAHEEAVEVMMRLPYACWTELVDVAVRYGAPTRRKRIGWVLIRLDALSCRVPKSCVGQWWLQMGECKSCGAGLADGRCVIEGCSSA